MTGVLRIWNGTEWVDASCGTEPEFDCADCDDRFLNADGDTMTGDLTVVDGWRMLLPGATNPLLRAELPPDSEFGVLHTTSLDVAGTIWTEGGVTVNAADLNLRFGTFFLENSSILLEDDEGNTMIALRPDGTVTLGAPPTGPMHATTKQYVDDAVAGVSMDCDDCNAHNDARYVNISGDTMTGDLNLTDPVRLVSPTGSVAIDAAIGQQIRLMTGGSIRLSINDNVVASSVPITVPVTPTGASQATSKQYVDNQVATRLDQATADARFVNADGDAMTGPLTLPAEPGDTMHAANKGYVDDVVTRYKGVTTWASTMKTFACSEAANLTYFTSATAVSAYVQQDSTNACPIGTRIDFVQAGAGKVTVAPQAGATLYPPTERSTRAQWSAATLVKVAANTWLLMGDISA